MNGKNVYTVSRESARSMNRSGVFVLFILLLIEEVHSSKLELRKIMVEKTNSISYDKTNDISFCLAQ